MSNTHCKCPGPPKYILAVPSGGCSTACEGGTEHPDSGGRVRGGASGGQQSFRRFDGAFENTPSFNDNRPMSIGSSGNNLIGYAIGLVTLGVAVYVIGYAFKKGTKAKSLIKIKK